DELARLEAADLAAQLGADAAAGSGDHHRAPPDPARDLALLELHRLAPEQVLDREVADARQVHLAADDLVDPGDDLGGEPLGPAEIADPADRLGRRVGDGDERLADLHAGADPAQLLGGPEHRHAVDHGADLEFVVVE